MDTDIPCADWEWTDPDGNPVEIWCMDVPVISTGDVHPLNTWSDNGIDYSVGVGEEQILYLDVDGYRYELLDYSDILPGEDKAIRILYDESTSEIYVNICESSNIIPIAWGTCDEHVFDITDYPPVQQNKSTSINILENTGNNIHIYPNPAIGSINIKTPTNFNGGRVTILDITGKNILDEYIGTGKTTIDISSFKPGVYSISIEQNGELILREKITKLRVDK